MPPIPFEPADGAMLNELAARGAAGLRSAWSMFRTAAGSTRLTVRGEGCSIAADFASGDEAMANLPALRRRASFRVVP